MAGVRDHKAKIEERELKPKVLMLGNGYDPSLSEVSVRPPLFFTLTFAFQAGEQTRDVFDHMAGRQAPLGEGLALSIPTSISRTLKSSRIGLPLMKRPKAGSCRPRAWRPTPLRCLPSCGRERRFYTTDHSMATPKVSSEGCSRSLALEASASRTVSMRRIFSPPSNAWATRDASP